MFVFNSVNYNEPSRISGTHLVRLNLSDPVLYIATLLSYLISYLLAGSSSRLTFVIFFALVYWLIDAHVESYRSFNIVRRCVRKLSRNKQSLQLFLGAHLGHNFSLDYQVDTFRWTNKLISSFWPHLSHVVHYELNRFIRTPQPLSKPSTGRMMRLIYAIGSQIDANIIAIEHCQLGAKAPFIKSIRVLVDYENDREPVDGESKGSAAHRFTRTRGSRAPTNKLLVYDLNLAYEGNMNMSFIYSSLCCCQSRVGLRDVFIHMRSRLAVGPVNEHEAKLSRLEFSLLELPEFGYRGIAIVELARLKLFRRSINRLIKEHLLFPKSISLSLKQLIERQQISERRRSQQAQQVSSRRKFFSCFNAKRNQEQLPFMTRAFAKLLVCSCPFTNCFLKCCCCCKEEDNQTPNGSSINDT